MGLFTLLPAVFELQPKVERRKRSQCAKNPKSEADSRASNVQQLEM